MMAYDASYQGLNPPNIYSSNDRCFSEWTKNRKTRPTMGFRLQRPWEILQRFIYWCLSCLRGCSNLLRWGLPLRVHPGSLALFEEMPMLLLKSWKMNICTVYIYIYCMFAYHYISYTPWMVVHVGGNVIILGDSIDLHRIPAKNTLLLVIHVHTLPLSKTNYSLDKLVPNLKITTTSYYANPANTDTNTHTRTNRTTHTTVLYYVYKQTSLL